MRDPWIFAAISTVLTALLATSASSAAADDWQVTVSPYAWAVSLNGETTMGGNKLNIDASFTDLVDNSDSLVGFNTDIEVRKGRVGFYLGPSYAKLGFNNVAKGTPLEGDLTTELMFVDAAASYRVVDWPMKPRSGGDDKMAVTVDVYGGVRYSLATVGIDFDNGGSPSEDKEWWDPIIGAESKVDLSPHWFLLFRGDFGGFGAGSDFTTNGSASIGYGFKICGHDFAARAGYRALFQDYHEGSGTNRFEWDMTLHGPTLGLMTFWG